VAFKLAELFVEISGKTGGIQGALTAVRTNLLGLGPMAEKLTGLIGQLGGSLLGLGPLGALAGGSLVAGLAVGGFAAIMKCVRAAADLNETLMKTEQIFGSTTDTVVAGADEMARKFGVARREFLDAASMFGGMLQGAGASEEEAAKMAVLLSRRAVDVASQMNTGNEEAMQRMLAALRGEYDPAERLGVFMSEASVKAKAYAMGLAGAGQELTLQQKMLARMQLLMDQTARAEGDAERSMGGWARQTEALSGNLENLAATLGQGLEPAAARVLGEINEWVLGLQASVELIDQMGRGLRGAVNALAGQAGFGPLFDEQAGADRERRAEIDRRNEAMRQQVLADQAGGGKAKTPRGFQGGLEEFARKVQSAAFGGEKLGKEQLAATRQVVDAVRGVARAIEGGRPGRQVLDAAMAAAGPAWK
jgi:hypothetical protein